MASVCAAASRLLLFISLSTLAIAIAIAIASTPLPLRSVARSRAQGFITALNLLPSDSVVGGSDGGPPLLESRLRLRVKGEPGSSVSPEELGQYAGYFKLKDTHASRMFYMFFESRGDKKNDPVVVWMSGGPGCSSELAVFYENGPFQITENLTLVWNDYGWDKVSNIIFVDQPIGTGFSYSTDIRDLRHDERGVSEDMYNFLQAFFEAHPQYANNEFYVTGESYAGHYVPAVTSRIYACNKAGLGLHINLKGFAIGNGLTNPEIQYKAYGDYALEVGLITEDDYKRISRMLPICSLSIKLCGSRGTIACMVSYLVCGSIFNSIMAIAGNVNYYDIRKECDGSLCYDFSNMEILLNDESVKTAIGVGDRKFVSCSPLVYELMIMDWMRNLETGIPELLEDGIKLLVYAGEYDLICNWLGNSRWVSAIDWSGKEKYAQAVSRPFMVNGEDAGLLTSSGPLSFLKVYDAGHMVPMDQPKASLEMIKQFTHQKNFDDLLVNLEGFLSEENQFMSW